VRVASLVRGRRRADRPPRIRHRRPCSGVVVRAFELRYM